MLFDFFEKLIQKRGVTPAFLPKEIRFLTIEKKVSIEYISSRVHETKLTDSDHFLTVSGNLHRTQVKKTLNKWISKQAKKYFIDELKKYSEKTGLTYQNVRFKNTKTRWGSCSEKKTINLNIQLLFLPKHLSHHVLLHEICHLQHLNHSKDFWDLVKKFEPNFKALEKELKLDGRKYVPNWIRHK